MKNLSLFFLVLFLLSLSESIQGQSNWVLQYSGTNAILGGVYLPDVNIGYVVGNNGLILKTTNAGFNWNFLNSGTTTNLWDVYFTNVNTGFAVGGILSVMQ